MRYLVIKITTPISGQSDFYAVVDTTPNVSGDRVVVGRFTNTAMATAFANAMNGA